MSKITDDIKSGLKGIRGVGDAVRGGLLDATDQAFDNTNKHPATLKNQAKNRAVMEKGKQDIRGADDMVARHEWQRKGVQPPAESSSVVGEGEAGPVVAGEAHSRQYGEPALQPGSGNVSYDRGESVPGHEPGEGVPQFSHERIGTLGGMSRNEAHDARGAGSGLDETLENAHAERYEPPVH